MYFRGGQGETDGREPTVKVPENYSGSAFRVGLPREESVDPRAETDTPIVSGGECSCSLPAHLTKRETPDGDDGNERERRSLGDEELLLLGIILLLSGGAFDGDILTLLVLLLL